MVLHAQQKFWMMLIEGKGQPAPGMKNQPSTIEASPRWATGTRYEEPALHCSGWSSLPGQPAPGMKNQLATAVVGLRCLGNWHQV